MTEKSKAEKLADELFTHKAGEADRVAIFEETRSAVKTLWWSKADILSRLQEFEREVRAEGAKRQHDSTSGHKEASTAHEQALEAHLRAALEQL